MFEGENRCVPAEERDACLQESRPSQMDGAPAFGSDSALVLCFSASYMLARPFLKKIKFNLTH